MSITDDVTCERLATPADMAAYAQMMAGRAGRAPESSWRAVATFADTEPANRALGLFAAATAPLLWLVSLTLPRHGKHEA